MPDKIKEKEYELDKLQDRELSSAHYQRGAKLDSHQKQRHATIKKLAQKYANTTALDIGCGFGDITHAVSNNFDTIIGTDIIHERVKWAATEFSPTPFLLSDACKLPFKDNYFNVVFSIVIINWLDSTPNHLDDVHRILNRSGKYILMVKAPSIFREQVRHLMGKRRTHTYYYRLSNIAKTVQDHGFVIEEIIPFYETIYNSIHSTKGLLETLILLPMRWIKAKSFSHYYVIVASAKKHK